MINFYKENNIQSIVLFFGIIFFCFFLSIANLSISNNIDEALIVGGIINVPDSNSPQLEFISNTKNLLVYFIVLLIKIGFSYYSISNILSFISTLFFFIGIFLVLKNIILYISEKYINIISFISTCLFIISDTHLPHTDYPNAYFASFTVGIYSIAISTLIFGLIIDGREKLTFFFSLILLLIHPVQGAWVISILIILNFCDKIFIKKNYNKAYLKKLLLLIIAILITITFIINNNYLDKNLNIDNNLLDIWLENWEAHRNNVKIKYNYLKPTAVLFFLSILCFYLFKKNKHEKIYKFYLFVILTVVLSTLVYVTYKLAYNYLPFFLIGPMPTRVINTHAMITYPIIIISIIYIINYLANFTKINNKILVTSFCIIFFIFFILNHEYNNLNDRFKNIYKNRFEKNYSNFLNNFNLRETEFYDEKFWNKINKLDDNFYTIVTPSTEILTYRYAKRPYIIKIKGFDYVSYSPSLLGATFEILKEIYGVNMYAKNLYINDEYIKLQFEKKSNFEWQEIKKKFNTKYVIVPINWNLNLKNILFNDKFAVYEI